MNHRIHTESRIRRNDGFTLIELMIAMMLSLFLIGGLILMHMSGRAATTDGEQLSRMQENIRFASDYIVRDVRNAGFRDEVGFLDSEGVAIDGITVGEADAIAEGFARVGEDGSELIIRYAGLGTCAEAFGDERFRLIENRYYFNDDTGELACEGSFEDGTRTVGLVSGLTGVSFQLVRAEPPTGETAAGGQTCTNSDPDSCIAVRIGLRFEGPRDLESPGQFEERGTEVTAAFRNTILDRAYVTDGS